MPNPSPTALACHYELDAVFFFSGTAGFRLWPVMYSYLVGKSCFEFVLEGRMNEPTRMPLYWMITLSFAFGRTIASFFCLVSIVCTLVNKALFIFLGGGFVAG